MVKHNDAIELDEDWTSWYDDCMLSETEPEPSLARALTQLFAFIQDSQDKGLNVYSTIGRGRTGNDALITLVVDGEKTYASGSTATDVASSLTHALTAPTRPRSRR